MNVLALEQGRKKPVQLLRGGHCCIAEIIWKTIPMVCLTPKVSSVQSRAGKHLPCNRFFTKKNRELAYLATEIFPLWHHISGRLIFIHLQCWEVLPFCRFQRQRCIKILCPKDPDFYTPLALKTAKEQHLPALEVYKNQSPNLDGQNRQSPIASVQRTSTLANHSAVPRGTNTTPTNANRAIRIAAQRTQGLRGPNSASLGGDMTANER